MLATSPEPTRAAEAKTALKRLRVALVADLLEERWPSMDLVTDMLFEQLRSNAYLPTLDVTLLRPAMPSRWPVVGRYVNRFWSYPRWVEAQAHAFDIFHIIDHSYAHLVHVLPAERTVVTCHDIDAFMPLLDHSVIRSKLPRQLTARVLGGLNKAGHVTCDSRATYDDVREHELVAEHRLTIVPNGIDPLLSPAAVPSADGELGTLLGAAPMDALEVLHVGSTIPRKRIDLLLDVFAAIVAVHPRARLLKAGGTLTAEQWDRARALGIRDHIVQLPFLKRDLLAALYRRAGVVMVTSDREGFGLPLVEAIACGTPIVVTDLRVFREVGGAAATYCPLGDINGWRDSVLALWALRQDPATWVTMRDAGIRHAATFSWRSYAAAMARIYGEIGGRLPSVTAQ